ncbi:MAG: sensor domain-containing diguanylate cyclase [Candidatus Eisenbacteria bacterium]
MSRTAAAQHTRTRASTKLARPRPTTHGGGRASARRHLELLAGALGWTSVELERQGAACEAAYAAGGRPATAAAFEARLLGWSREVVERRPEAIESKRLTALAELAQIARDAESTEAALTSALAALRQSVGFENATFFLYDRITETLVPAATSGAHVDLIPEVQFDLGQGLSSWVARSRRPVLLAELRGDEDSETPGARPGSFLSVPLIVARDLVGVLNVGHARPGAFTEADKDLLSAAGAILASTLARQAAFDEARRRSLTDDLTGLANRAHFEARIAEEIEKSRRYGYPFSLVLVDPERFALLNQAYGRGYADSCLVSLAGLLKQCVRKSDVVARLAPGDEFALLLPHQGLEPARAAAERIQAAIGAHSFPRRRRLSVRLGVATFPQDGSDGETLIARARP